MLQFSIDICHLSIVKLLLLLNEIVQFTTAMIFLVFFGRILRKFFSDDLFDNSIDSTSMSLVSYLHTHFEVTAFLTTICFHQIDKYLLVLMSLLHFLQDELLKSVFSF